MQMYAEFNEFCQRGTVDFPIEVYRLDQNHPRYQMPYHWHHEMELLRVLSGSIVLSLDEREYSLPAGSAVLISSGVLHGGTPQDCRYECIVFDAETLLKNSAAGPVLQRLFDGEITLRPLLPVEELGTAAALDELFSAMEHPEGAGRLLILSALYRLFGSLLRCGCYDGNPEKNRSARRKMVQLKHALAFMEEHFSEQVTLEQIAAQAEMSPRYFCRFFQELTHRSPVEYLNYYRIEQAGDRLLHSALSVTEIAYSCGFNDLSYFIRVFKKQKGVTPKKYEETQRQRAAAIKRSEPHPAQQKTEE
ncbi:MAG: AraC family transcriptional regulator [Firmicutes bacterium]|nr:AraC family transcriptional regulator [Bacillota bacterium]